MFKINPATNPTSVPSIFRSGIRSNPFRCPETTPGSQVLEFTHFYEDFVNMMLDFLRSPVVAVSSH
jgi:hypothetical protein